MYSKHFMKLITARRLTNLRIQQRPQLYSVPLRFYNKPGDPRDPKPTEKRESRHEDKGFVDDNESLRDASQRPIHKANPLKGEGQLEGELYEEMHKNTTAGGNSPAQNESSSVHSEETPHDSGDANTSTPKKVGKYHRYLFLLGLLLGAYE